jgi:hypothetical protein
MWDVTEREAAAMYARASLKWYGVARAASVARTMERKLGKKGDLKGVRAWRLVAEELVRPERSGATQNERQSHPVAVNVRRAG